MFTCLCVVPGCLYMTRSYKGKWIWQVKGKCIWHPMSQIFSICLLSKSCRSLDETWLSDTDSNALSTLTQNCRNSWCMIITNVLGIAIKPHITTYVAMSFTFPQTIWDTNFFHFHYKEVEAGSSGITWLRSHSLGCDRARDSGRSSSKWIFISRNLNIYHLKIIPIGSILPKIYFGQSNVIDDSSCFYYLFISRDKCVTFKRQKTQRWRLLILVIYFLFKLHLRQWFIISQVTCASFKLDRSEIHLYRCSIHSQVYVAGAPAGQLWGQGLRGMLCSATCTKTSRLKGIRCSPWNVYSL